MLQDTRTPHSRTCAWTLNPTDYCTVSVRYIHVQYTAHGRVVTNNYDQIQVYRHWLELGSLLLGAGLPTMEGSEGVGETGEYAGGGVSVWQKQTTNTIIFLRPALIALSTYMA